MALITKNVREHAEKCKACVLQKLRKYLETGLEGGGRSALDRDTSRQLLKLTNVIEKIGCNLCPYKDDFQKVYGMRPVDYFMQNEMNTNRMK